MFDKMKKLYHKTSKQNWRITVPNVNSSIIRRINRNETRAKEKFAKRSSGSYDIQEAQRQYDRERSVPNNFVFCDSAPVTTIGEDSSEYASTSTLSSKNSTPVEEKINDNSDNKFIYDVPKISFNFIEQDPSPSEGVKVNGATVDSNNTTLLEDENYENVIVENGKIISNENCTNSLVIRRQPPIPEILLSDTSKRENNKNSKQSTFRRSGSYPNIIQYDESDTEDENIYKVPRPLKLTRSISLSEISLHDCEDLTDSPKERKDPDDDNNQAEHTSRAESESHQQNKSKSTVDLEDLDYCRARSELPIGIRRPSLIKKQKGAVNKWNNFRTKFIKIVNEHAAQQRVGAFDDKERTPIRLNEVLSSSKMKCRKIFESTGKIFARRKSDTSGNETSSQIVKSDEFFAKLKASDIEYKLNTDGEDSENEDRFRSKSEDRLNEFTLIRPAAKRNKCDSEGQKWFEDLRKYVKQGGDFCKELASILQERSETETQYAKSLSKLSHRLTRALHALPAPLDGWRAVAQELECRAECHRQLATLIGEQAAGPLRKLAEAQQRGRKQAEHRAERAARQLHELRGLEGKGKRGSHQAARENERLQDQAVWDMNRQCKMQLSQSPSRLQINNKEKSCVEKENAKLEGKKKKAEDAVKKADIEYYTLCVRAERARLEWESAVLRGVETFQSLEEERLHNLKLILSTYLHHSVELGPKLIEITDRLKMPVEQTDPAKDLNPFINLKQSTRQISEQLLPDFYCEHINLAMNRERRRQALVKLLHLIRQDVERERKSKNGLEKLSNAIKNTPNTEEAHQQSVAEKLYHMKSMLTYLEGTRYKIQSVLAGIDNRPHSGHPLAPHIIITRDKSGLQQSILKVPNWLKEEFFDRDKSPMSEKSEKYDKLSVLGDREEYVDWGSRGTADGNSNQLDSDFDEFSSQCSSGVGTGNCHGCTVEEVPLQPIARCRALYLYTPNLPDELPLKPGDMLQVYRQQEDGWWLGECDGNVGIFPATYVQVITPTQ